MVALFLNPDKMLFNSFDFLFFFPIAVVVFYLLKHRYRWVWLLCCSYFFYMYLEPMLLLLLWTSTLVDYYCGLKMDQHDAIKVRRRYLYLSIFTNLGLLFFFKYFVFFTVNASEILSFFGIHVMESAAGGHSDYVKILLPIGISFYTFQTMSYSIDVYRREIPAQRHLGKYALFVSFFPQLVAGPIERTIRLLPQFSKEIHFDASRIKKGMIMMAWGFFLKLVVADRLGVYVDDVFYRAADYKGLPLVLGSYFFAFQIYYDFSAYCAIAIGAANVFGYDLMQNFDRPFFFSSYRELWRKWHISLMDWFRDYLYVPLLKNLKFSKASAVLVVFFFTGLWHGASWTFVVWGVLCGILLITEVLTIDLRKSVLRAFGLSYDMKVIKILNWMVLFSLLVLTLVFFRSKSIGQAGIYLNNMFSLSSTGIDVYHDKVELFLSLFLIVIVQLIHFYKGNDRIYELVWNRPRWLRWILYVGFILVMILLSVNRQNNFIYFQF